MIHLERRQIIIIAAFLLIPVLLIAGFSGGRKSEREAEETSNTTLLQIPDAEVAENNLGKVESYRIETSARSHWESLAREDEEVHSQHDGEHTMSSSPGKPTVEDIFGEFKEAASEPERDSTPKAPAKRVSGTPTASKKEVPIPVTDTDKKDTSFHDCPLCGSNLDCGFWEEKEITSSKSNALIRCSFVRSEKIRSGDIVTLRLLDDLHLEGKTIHENSHLIGTVTFGNRVLIDVNSIIINGTPYFIGMEAYDLDGGKGLFCRELDDVSRRVAEQGISTLSNEVGSRVGRIARDIVNLGSGIARSKISERSINVYSNNIFYLKKREY